MIESHELLQYVYIACAIVWLVGGIVSKQKKPTSEIGVIFVIVSILMAVFSIFCAFKLTWVPIAILAVLFVACVIGLFYICYKEGIDDDEVA